MTDNSDDEDYDKHGYNKLKLNFVDDPHPMFAWRPPLKILDKDNGWESDVKDEVHFAPFVDKYLSEVLKNVQLNMAHMCKLYDYHQMFAYLSNPTFCKAVNTKHILHITSIQKNTKEVENISSSKRTLRTRSIPVILGRIS